VSKLEVSVVGAGVVGCATAVGLATKGHDVHLVERDKSRLSAIKNGKWKPTEPNLGITLKAMIDSRQLTASSRLDLQKKTDVLFICVGTPSSKDGVSDLSFLQLAIDDVIQLSNEEYSPLISVRSTTPPGTLKSIQKYYSNDHRQNNRSTRVRIASNPEFLREGFALNDFLHPNRIVLGVDCSQDSLTLKQVYEGIEAPIIEVPISTAEMIKSASNAFLATKISFINEIGRLCKQLDIDTYEVARGLGYDERIGNQYLDAGLGFGGSCIPKDLRALIHLYSENKIDSPLLSSVLKVNETQAQVLAEMIETKYGTLKQKRIAVLGLSFKPGTDTVMESPSINLIHLLLDRGALISVHDPEAMAKARDVLGAIVDYIDNLHEAIHTADLVIIATSWKEYSDSHLYQGKAVIDARRAIDDLMIPEGTYEGLAW
jgi:UDPglucose 6-dehydrogenase